MSTKHTPGPWYASKVEDRTAYNIFPYGATYALLTVSGPVYDGAHPYALQAESNARLIAAAPELLEFAEEVRRTGDTRLASMAISIIAKATGEQS